jgi:8-oxo-dGTP pyrophosphatase MutT (NUDIX family)
MEPVMFKTPCQEYVCGFMIQWARKRVLLIHKTHPAFQAGKWNGIGGHIESGETMYQAMVREFQEETGVTTGRLWNEPHADPDWQHTVTLWGSDFAVHYLRIFVDNFPAYRTTTDEVVKDWDIEAVYDPEHNHEGVVIGYRCPTLENMKWILPIQLSHNIVFPVVVQWAKTDEAKA